MPLLYYMNLSRVFRLISTEVFLLIVKFQSLIKLLVVTVGYCDYATDKACLESDQTTWNKS